MSPRAATARAARGRDNAARKTSATKGVAVSDTPIYDQLRLELSSENSRELAPSQGHEETDDRGRRYGRDQSKDSVVPSARDESTGRRSVSVWSLVNRNK